MRLLVFMIEFDADSKLLASNTYWIKELTKLYSDVTVVSTHQGRIPQELQGKINALQLGGGSLNRKFVAFCKLLCIGVSMIKDRKNLHVFHHMIHWSCICPGVIFRLWKIPQVLWYSHAKTAKGLYVASLIAKNIVSPAKSCFPLSEKFQVVGIGQGIPLGALDLGTKPFLQMAKRQHALVSVGRIAPIKHLETALTAIKQCAIKGTVLPFDMVGPIQDAGYAKSLESDAIGANIGLRFIPAKDYREIYSFLQNYKFYFSGTVKAVDRAGIEAAIVGCIVISTNENLVSLTGMKEVWRKLGYDKSILSLYEQIKILTQLETSVLQEISDYISAYTMRHNDLTHVCESISALLYGSK